MAVTGPLGHAAAGLALLSAGLVGAGLGGEQAWASLVTAQLRPAPPYDAGPEAAALGAHAMIDVSDGLLADLGHIADASGVQIDVDSAAAWPGSPLLEAARAVQMAGLIFLLAERAVVSPPSTAMPKGWPSDWPSGGC